MLETKEIRQMLLRMESSKLYLADYPEMLKQKVLGSPALQPMLAEIRAEGEALLATAIPELSYTLFRIYFERGTRMEYETAYFNRRNRLRTFGLLAWLEPDNLVFRDALCDTLWAVCDEYTWCVPAHLAGEAENDPALPEGSIAAGKEVPAATIDLFSAETAFALAELLHLHGDNLPQLVRKRVISEVLHRVLIPFTERSFFWEESKHNWAAVCAGSVGAAALYILDNAEDTAVVLARVLPAMDSFLSGYPADGACTEGYGYWQYGFGFYVYFADLLKTRTGGALDLLAEPKIRQIAMFQQKAFLDDCHTVSFSDTRTVAGVFMGLSHYLHARFEEVDIPSRSYEAAYMEDHCYRWASSLRNLIWQHGETEGQPWRPASYYLPEAQWLISRHESQGRRFVFAAKGGHNDEPHNHNDVGNFILFAEGTTLLADMGSGQYTSGYFGPERYNILCNASFGHSVPIINGMAQSPGGQHRAADVQMESGELTETFSLDLAQVYEDNSLLRLKRRFTWTKTSQPVLMLEDSYQFASPPESVTERFITPLKPRIEEDAVILSSDQAALRIVFDNKLLAPEIQVLQHKAHRGRLATFYALDFAVIRTEQNMKLSLRFELSGG
ncbi:hypothetical protein [Paenibacillus sp. IHBB 3054]|uniref:hypothetical protein n=1 Tax=Paenibacillus sp. IHBB 3054 TaxID=3425689 RepID=UPI003F67D39B